MKNFLIEAAIIIRDVMAGALLTIAIVLLIASWVLLDVRL